MKRKRDQNISDLQVLAAIQTLHSNGNERRKRLSQTSTRYKVSLNGGDIYLYTNTRKSVSRDEWMRITRKKKEKKEKKKRMEAETRKAQKKERKTQRENEKKEKNWHLHIEETDRTMV